MSEPVFMFDGEAPEMVAASQAARKSFKYFWRELCWEGRRIIPGLDVAMIKLPFTDGTRTDGNPEYEQMWCTNVKFDGEFLKGQLINSPNWLVSVKEGDEVHVPFSHLSDWIMTTGGVAYGAHTVNVMRAGMDYGERRAHDRAWGLDFGDPSTIRSKIDRSHRKKPGIIARLFGKKPSEPAPAPPQTGFEDHPMCVNMLEAFETQLQGDPSIATTTDDRGWTLLHGEALAGNLGIIKLLIKHGADVHATTSEGKDAASLARGIGWEEIAMYLDGVAQSSR